MRIVNYRLEAVSAGSALEPLQSHSYICHRCEKFFKAASDDLYFFPDEDAVYHRHPDAIFYRAFTIRPDGVIEIGAFDSVEEDVIQRYALALDGRGDCDVVGFNELKPRSKAFFDSMKRQNRRVVPAQIQMRFGDS